MKALVYTGRQKLEYKDSFASPKPACDETLVQVEYVGICGSDMHAYLGHDERRPAPLILGHEAAGRILSGAHAGQRVTVNPLVCCQECTACKAGQDNLCPQREIISMPPRQGAFAEKIAIPSRNLVFVPDEVPSEKAALAEPLACGWNAASKAKAYWGEDFAGTKALLLGGGAIGVGAALALKAQGCADITLSEAHEGRRDFICQKIGLNAVSPDEIASGSSFDFAIDGVGIAATRAQASAKVRPGGLICHIGLGSGEGGLDIRRMTLQEIRFVGCYTYSAQDFRDTAKALFEGRLGALDWTEIRPLKQGAQAFADLQAGKVFCPKIILQPYTKVH